LKKKTASETILQRSLSQHRLLQHAGAILKAQEAEKCRARATLNRTNTDLDHFHHRRGSSWYSLACTLTATSSSGMVSPGERRHIHFNNEVMQCIAVEAKEGEEEDEWLAAFEDESSDEGAVMMPLLRSRASVSNHSTQRSSLSCERKTIAPLPSTILRYRGDVPEAQTNSIMGQWSVLQPLSTSPTSLVETLRPPQRSADDLLDEEDAGLVFAGLFASDDDWYRSWVSPHPANAGDDEDENADRRLRLTASGMFMPFDEGEAEAASTSILDRAMDMVNMARDIAHVIWNVCWWSLIIIF
jgi:hypothetical protein